MRQLHRDCRDALDELESISGVLIRRAQRRDQPLKLLQRPSPSLGLVRSVSKSVELLAFASTSLPRALGGKIRRIRRQRDMPSCGRTDWTTASMTLAAVVCIVATTVLAIPPATGEREMQPASRRRSSTKYLLAEPNASSAPTIYDTALTREAMAEINRRFGKLSPGKALFRVPEEMTVAEPGRAVARIATAGQERDLLKWLSGSGKTVIWKQDRLTATMKARLTGPDFDITTGSPEEQFIAGDQFTEWIWTVTPTASGDKYLELHISAVLTIEGFEKARDFPITTRRVRVHVNPIHSLGQFISSNFTTVSGWLFGLIALAWPWIKASLQKLTRRSSAKATPPIEPDVGDSTDSK